MKTIVPDITDELIKAYMVMVATKKIHTKIKELLEPKLLTLVINSKIKVADKYIGEHRAKYPKGTLITAPSNIYLSDDDDAKEYFKNANVLYSKNGFDVELNYCPILMSRENEVKSEHKFIDESMYLVNGDEDFRRKLNITKNRKSWLKKAGNLVSSVVEKDLKYIKNLENLLLEMSNKSRINDEV